MKLGLLGYPINHSLSPDLYRKILGEKLESYELFSFDREDKIPSLKFFQESLDGLNITTPYKTHFIHEVETPSPLIREIGAINTLAFRGSKVLGTNTDVIAVRSILRKYLSEFPKIHILLLGDGVMAQMTLKVARDMGLSIEQFSRRKNSDFLHLDLTKSYQSDAQNIIINACSRDYIFQNKLLGHEIFWDYNYSFIPHQKTLPSQVLAYHDGQEMLELQARAAIEFWNEVIPKLK